jgi:hypothetical protein
VTNLSLSNEKFHMIHTEGVVLGHHISPIGIQVDPAKIEVIRGLPVPTTQKDVHIILGHARYYQRFIEKITKLASPLFKLLTKAVEFPWIDLCQTAFETLKEKLSIAPILWGPNWSLDFHISTNASDRTIGVVLGKKEEQQPYVIDYVSKNLTHTEKNYTITEKEFIVVVYSINKFHHYIRDHSIFVHTHHSTIRYLMNKSLTNVG